MVFAAFLVFFTAVYKGQEWTVEMKPGHFFIFKIVCHDVNFNNLGFRNNTSNTVLNIKPKKTVIFTVLTHKAISIDYNTPQ